MKSDELHDCWDADSPPPGFSARVMDAYSKEKTVTSKAIEVVTPSTSRRSFRRGIVLSLSCAVAIVLGIVGAHRLASRRIEKEPLASTQGPDLAPSATPSAAAPPPSTALTVGAPVADVSSAVSVQSAPRAADLSASAKRANPNCSPHDPLCNVDRSGAVASDSQVGGPLTAGDIQNVINLGESGVQRSCWEHLSHGPPAPSQSRVNVTMLILATGRVGRASGAGGDGYTGLADCVVRITNRWVFPKSDSSTTVNIPFQFTSVE
jgi:hypothetical protein